MFTSILDVDKLQENVNHIIEGGGLPRGIGRTTALLYLLLGDVELGDNDNTYMFVSNNAQASRRVQTLFVSMLQDHEIHHDYQHSFGRVRMDNGTTVFFLGLSQFLTLDAYRGVRVNRVFMDVSPELLCKEDSVGSLDYPIGTLKAQGADFV